MKRVAIWEMLPAEPEYSSVQFFSATGAERARSIHASRLVPDLDRLTAFSDFLCGLDGIENGGLLIQVFAVLAIPE